MPYKIPEILDFSTPTGALDAARNLQACLYKAVEHIPANQQAYMNRLAAQANATYLIGLDLNTQTALQIHDYEVGSLLEDGFGHYQMEVLPAESYVRADTHVSTDLSEADMRDWMGKVFNMKKFSWQELIDERPHSLFFLMHQASKKYGTSSDMDFPDDLDWASRMSSMYRATSLITRCTWRGWDVLGFRDQVVQYANAALGYTYPFVLQKTE